MVEQLLEGEVAAFEHATVDWRPLGKNNRLGILADRFQGKGVALYDVAFKDELNGIQALLLNRIFKQCRVALLKTVIKPCLALFDIVFKNVNSVERGYSKDGVPFVFKLVFTVS